MTEKIVGDWGSDEFSKFMRDSDYNARATSTNFQPLFQKLKQIDNAFGKLMEVVNRSECAPATFAAPSRSAYRASAMLALSGQNNEAMMVLRGCIEHSLYAFHFFKHPENYRIWADRHESESDRKKVLKTFTNRGLLNELKRHDSHCGEVAETLYESFIDYGAHPNVRGYLGRTQLQRTEKGDIVVHEGLDVGSEFHKLSLKRTAQTGIACLKIFGLIFSVRFAITSLDLDTEKASQGL